MIFAGDDDGVVGGSDDRGNGVSTSIGVALPPLIIGRSSKQNDRVSFEVAKDHHLWFHVQGSPGSHCLLQLDPGDKGRATEECLQYAAGSSLIDRFSPLLRYSSECDLYCHVQMLPRIIARPVVALKCLSVTPPPNM